MSNDESFYEAPTSTLTRPVSGDARSLDEAMAGNWDFEVMPVIREAWERTSGSKGVIWLGLLISFAASFVFQMLGAGIATTAGGPESATGLILMFGIQMIGSLINWVVTSGLYLYGIKRAAGDEDASLSDVLSAFSQAGPLIGLWFLMILMVMAGFALLILPGIYLSIAYMLAIPLRMERGLGLWEALETSRKTIHHHWWRVLWLMIVSGLAALALSIVTLGIGLVWAYPFFFLVFGVLYTKAFGYPGSAG